MQRCKPVCRLSSIEPLEDRIAPAVIFAFTDVDGDQVKIVSNKPLTATVNFAPNGNPANLILIGPGMDGANISTVVTRGPDGDGLVNIGRITATGLDLGAVKVKGDLAKIIAGNDANSLPAIKSLTARSMGIYDISTQGSGNLTSSITGDVGAITILGDVIGSRLVISGNVGVVKIGGDLQGTSTNQTGRIDADSFTSITIGGDLRAGTGDESGKIQAYGNVGSLTIRGSVYGARDAVVDSRGQIYALGKVGPITIGRDIFGGVSEQLTLDLRNSAGPITIGGTIFGGTGTKTGGIFVAGDAGLIKIRQDVIGGSGINSGQIRVDGDVAGISIGGDLRGGSGIYSASIDVNGKSTGPIRIARDVVGGTGDFSASLLVTGTVGGFTIGGDLRGSSASYQDGVRIFQVAFAGSTGPVKIGGEIIGGTGRGSSVLSLGSGAPSFFLGGSVVGGGSEVVGVVAFPSGSIALGSVATITIKGDIRESAFTGGAVLIKTVKKLTIGGSVTAAQAYADTIVSGGTPLQVNRLGSGRIGGSIVGSPEGLHATVVIDTVTGTLEIAGSLEGNSGQLSGTVAITGGAASIKIGGSLRAGTGFGSGAILANGRIGSLKVNGGVEGGNSSGYTSAQVNAQSFGRVMIGGDLVGNAPGAGSIRAVTGGFDAITIGGSLYAGSAGGSLVAATTLGVVKIGGNISGGFATNHSSLLAASATSITIGRDVFANGNGGNVLIDIRDSTGPIKIGGDVRGSANEPARLLFSMVPGQTEPGFASLSIKGSVSNALIAGGLRGNLTPQNGDAVLGPVTVGGDWTASTLSAGIVNGTNNLISNSTPELSRIASITIKGQVRGTAAAGDAYRFIAERIGSVKIAGVRYTPSTTPIQLDALFGDVTLRLAGAL